MTTDPYMTSIRNFGPSRPPKRLYLVTSDDGSFHMTWRLFPWQVAEYKRLGYRVLDIHDYRPEPPTHLK